MNPDINITLLEATGKKCEFLKEVATNLNLTGVRVINGRAEDYAKKADFREQFDTVTARAVARLNILCEYCMPFVKVGGIFLSYKGGIGEEEVDQAKKAISTLGGSIIENYQYDLFDAKRMLVSIKKVKNTEEKYPRANGVIRKKPL